MRNTTRLGLAGLVILGLGLLVAGPPSPLEDSPDATRSTVVLTPEDATWTSAREPSTPHESTSYLRSSASQDSTYLKFDSSSLRGMEVVAASLQLTVRSGSTRDGAIVVRQASPNWSSPTLTHDLMASTNTAVLGEAPITAGPGSTMTIPLVRRASLSPEQPIALRLDQSQGLDATEFGRNGSEAPRLTLTLLKNSASATDDPTDLRKVFAHYFPPYPVSLDNEEAGIDYYTQHYLSIEGEGGKHAAYGGLLRDRPTPRPPIESTDWRLEDLRTEVRQAKEAGIDGFTLNILSTSGANWKAGLDLMRAASEVGGFSVVPNVDVNASIGTEAPTVVASKLAELYAYPSAQMIEGDYVLSSFKAEGKPVDWWKDVITSLEQTHQVPIKFIAVFLDAEEHMSAFAPISYGFGNWGPRTAAEVTGAPDLAAQAHALERRWMSPVAFQDARPRKSVYAEAGNTETGRATWAKAIEDGADYVQIVTWNDYSESTQIAPSDAHASVFLDLTAYYGEWFKTGRAPPVTTDHLYVTHRMHPWSATPTSGSASMTPDLGGATTPPRDTVEALVFLTSPATVSITSGDITRRLDLEAGISAATIPLGLGVASAQILRGSEVAVSVTSPHPVTAAPLVQDLQYFAVGR